tara:strand:+ start:67 stop:864 length:798 start_codon:yes stop_codon:yes gene_type:complete
MEVLLTGLDIEKKAEVYLDAVFHNLGGKEQFDDVDVQLIRSDHEDPESNEVAHAALRITVTSDDPKKLGRLFSAKVTELGLAGIPGNTGRGAAGFNGGPAIIHWPTLIDSQLVTEKLHIDGKTEEVLPTQRLGLEDIFYQETPVKLSPAPTGETVKVPFGRLFGTRSGDKGGNANCGVWALTDDSYSFLHEFLTVEKLKALCPDLAAYDIERFELPNLKALNFYIKGILGTGAASNHRIDKQAKSMGEYLRAKMIDVPESIAPRS